MRKGKFNVVDLFVALSIICVLVVGIWYFFLKDVDMGATLNQSEEQAVVFVAKAYEVNKEAVDLIKAGDILVALDTYQPGKVLEVIIESSQFVEAIDGQLVTVNDPALYDLTVTIEAYPNIQKAYMDLGNQQIIVGNPYWIKTADMHAQGEIIAIID